jgi:hypothetical protein
LIAISLVSEKITPTKINEKRANEITAMDFFAVICIDISILSI